MEHKTQEKETTLMAYWYMLLAVVTVMGFFSASAYFSLDLEPVTAMLFAVVGYAVGVWSLKASTGTAISDRRFFIYGGILFAYLVPGTMYYFLAQIAQGI